MRDYGFKIQKTDKSLGQDKALRDIHVASALLCCPGVALLDVRRSTDPETQATYAEFVLTTNAAPVTLAGLPVPFLDARARQFGRMDSGFTVEPRKLNDAREQLLDALRALGFTLRRPNAPEIEL